MARKYTTGFEEGNPPASSSNYYDQGREQRLGAFGRNGAAIGGTYGKNINPGSPYHGLDGATILPVPYSGSEGSDYPHSRPGEFGFVVSPNVGVALRMYMNLGQIPPIGSSELKLLAQTGVLGDTAPTFNIGFPSQAAIRIGPDGRIGLWMPSTTSDEQAAAVAADSLPGTSTDFPWGSDIMPLDWTCLEIAYRMGTPKGWAAIRVNETVISEAKCVTFPWDSYGNADAFYAFMVRELPVVLGAASPVTYPAIDDVAINDETGDTDNTWPGQDTGVFFGGSHPDCLADPAGSGYYDCGLTDQPPLPPSCPLATMLTIGDAQDELLLAS